MKFPKITRFRIFATLLFICVIYFVILVSERILTIFNVTANTEILECYSDQKQLSNINLFDAEIYTMEDDVDLIYVEKQLYSGFKGMMALNDSVVLKMERLSHGSLLLEAERPTGGIVATLKEFETGKVMNVDDIIFITINKIDSLIDHNASIVLPFSGTVKLGKSIDVESDNEYSLVLRDGDITMTGYTPLTNSYFVAGKEKLYLGDMLTIDDDKAIGFATVNESPAIQVSYRTIGKEARIIKPGPKDMNSGYRFSATIFSRFKYDAIFQRISILFAVILTCVTIGDFLLNVYNQKNQNNR